MASERHWLDCLENPDVSAECKLTSENKSCENHYPISHNTQSVDRGVRTLDMAGLDTRMGPGPLFSSDSEDDNNTMTMPSLSPRHDNANLNIHDEKTISDHSLEKGEFDSLIKLEHPYAQKLNESNSTTPRKRTVSYYCPHSDCPEFFINLQQMKTHMALQHDGKFVSSEKSDNCPEKNCPVSSKWNDDYCCEVENCDEKFPSSDELAAHVKTHEIGDTHKCTIHNCEESFQTLAELREHVYSHRDKRIFTCRICEQSYQFSYQLHEHMQSHDDDDDDETDPLNRSGGSQKAVGQADEELMDEDLDEAGHSAENQELLCCSYENCRQTFTSTAVLEIHESSHSGMSISHICKICQKVFQYNYLLDRHMKVHKKFKCETADCEQSFETLEELGSHEVSHKQSRQRRKSSLSVRTYEVKKKNIAVAKKRVLEETGSENEHSTITPQLPDKSTPMKKPGRGRPRKSLLIAASEEKGETKHKIPSCGGLKKLRLNSQSENEVSDTPVRSRGRPRKQTRQTEAEIEEDGDDSESLDKHEASNDKTKIQHQNSEISRNFIEKNMKAGDKNIEQKRNVRLRGRPKLGQDSAMKHVASGDPGRSSRGRPRLGEDSTVKDAASGDQGRSPLGRPRLGEDSAMKHEASGDQGRSPRGRARLGEDSAMKHEASGDQDRSPQHPDQATSPVRCSNRATKGQWRSTGSKTNMGGLGFLVAIRQATGKTPKKNDGKTTPANTLVDGKQAAKTAEDGKHSEQVSESKKDRGLPHRGTTLMKRKVSSTDVDEDNKSVKLQKTGKASELRTPNTEIDTTEYEPADPSVTQPDVPQQTTETQDNSQQVTETRLRRTPAAAKQATQASAAEKQATQASAAEKQATRASAAEKQATQASAAEKQATQASAAEKQATQASAAEKQASQASAAEKQATQASAAEKQASLASAAEKQTTQASAAEKQATQASAAEKQATQASAAEKQASRTSAVEKQATQASAAEKQATQESVAEKQATQASAAEKQATQASAAEKQATRTSADNSKTILSKNSPSIKQRSTTQGPKIKSGIEIKLKTPVISKHMIMTSAVQLPSVVQTARRDTQSPAALVKTDTKSLLLGSQNQKSLTVGRSSSRTKQTLLHMNKGKISCIVPFCSSGTKAKMASNTALYFTTFPANTAERSEWISILKLPADIVVTENTQICNLHFKPSDFRKQADGTWEKVSGCKPRVYY